MIETIGSVAPSSISITTARPDLFFVNGAAVPSLQKKDSTFSNHREGLDAVRVNGLGGSHHRLERGWLAGHSCGQRPSPQSPLS
jgi:hypothetical protein